MEGWKEKQNVGRKKIRKEWIKGGVMDEERNWVMEKRRAGEKIYLHSSRFVGNKKKYTPVWLKWFYIYLCIVCVYLWRHTSQCVYEHIHSLKYFKAEKGQKEFVFSIYHVWTENWIQILMSPQINLS